MTHEVAVQATVGPSWFHKFTSLRKAREYANTLIALGPNPGTRITIRTKQGETLFVHTAAERTQP